MEGHWGKVDLEAVIEGMIDGVVVTDLEGRIIQVNEPTLDMYGYGRGEAIGKKITDFISEEEVSRALELMDEALETGEPVRNVEFTGVGKDGDEFPILVNGTVLRDEDGEPSQLLVVFRDITERRRREAERIRREISISASETMVGDIVREFRVRTSAEALGLDQLLRYLATLSTSPSKPGRVLDLMISGIQKNLREEGVEASEERIREIVAPHLSRFLRRVFAMAGESKIEVSPAYEEFEGELAPQ